MGLGYAVSHVAQYVTLSSGGYDEGDVAGGVAGRPDRGSFIGDLVVVLDEVDEPQRLQVRHLLGVVLSFGYRLGLGPIVPVLLRYHAAGVDEVRPAVG